MTRGVAESRRFRDAVLSESSEDGFWNRAKTN